MEDEIKVNEYIRTKNGEIAKVIECRDEIVLDKEIKFYGMYRGYICEDELDFIVKHSSNLIDLIQCGDYVNGYKALKKSKKVKHKIMICVFEDEMSSNWITISNENIETIVTKEQFESISYKVTEM